jgi:hypothetical protein
MNLVKSKKVNKFSKIKLLSLVIAVVMILTTGAFAAAKVVEMVAPNYKILLDGKEIPVEGNAYNYEDSTYVKLRTVMEGLEGMTVEWDDTVSPREARFISNAVEAPEPVIITENVSLSWNEVQKQVVRIAVDTTTTDNTNEAAPVTTQNLKVIGNGIFVSGRKIITTIDTYKNYEGLVNGNTINTEVGGAQDENAVEELPAQTTTAVTGIKIILSDGTIKDAKNYRTDDDRIMGLLDTKAYTSKNVATFAKENLKVGEMSVLCTSIFSNAAQNPLQVANQFSFGEVLRTRYPRNNQYFTVSDNDTDNADSGRAGAIFNAKGELAGIFNDVEVGNNGNCFFTPKSVIEEFLND